MTVRHFVESPIEALQWDGTNPLDFAKWTGASPSISPDGSLKVLVAPKRSRLIPMKAWLICKPGGVWEVATADEFAARYSEVDPEGSS